MDREPEVLILGSRHDLTCDFVVAALRRKGVPYVRLNSEDLPTLLLDLEPTTATLTASVEESTFVLTDETLRSVLFRRPTYLRHYGVDSSPPAELLRTHWATFLRSLTVFERALWVNHPRHTYFAEHKALQLKCASRLGFSVPRTRIGNTVEAALRVADGDDQVVVKGLDPVLLRTADEELFGFTQFVAASIISEGDLQAAPVILQEPLRRKTDLRVTVVGKTVFAVEVTRNGLRIDGDWRISSRDAEYTPTTLPDEIGRRCIALVRLLGLEFGAIDLALQDGRYYFLEVNPTGEWAWLVDAAGLAIDQAVADLLIAGLQEQSL